MHLIRILISGITILREATVPIQLPSEQRQSLLKIKSGQMEWSEINDWRLQLHADFECAFRDTKLPERPDYTAANDFLIAARKEIAEMAQG